jgi:dihydrofolate reductase
MFGGDPTAKAWKLETVSQGSLHIMGSRTFAGMAAYWPTSTDLFAPAMNEIPKAVFSKQGSAILTAAEADTQPSAKQQPGADSWGEAYVAGGDLTDEITKLKALDGKPIIAHGGATFARSLIARQLVDRYALLVHPIALGGGLAIFSDVAAPRRLELIGSTTFPGGAVAHTYRPA